MILMVAALSGHVLGCRRFDHISDTICSRIHPILRSLQPLQLLLVVLTDFCDRGRARYHLFGLLCSLFLVLIHLPVIAVLTTFAPLISHFGSLLLLVPHLTDQFILQLQGHGLFRRSHLTLQHARLIALDPDLAAIVLARLLLIDALHLRLKLKLLVCHIDFFAVKLRSLHIQRLFILLLRRLCR